MTAIETYPLINGYAAGSTVAWDAAQSIPVEEFLRATAAVATALPDAPFLVNVCEDRYWFLVAFAAAVWRGIPNLLPHNRTNATLANVRDRYPGAVFVSDQDQPPAGHVGFNVRGLAAHPIAGVESVPHIPANRTAAIVFTSGSTGAPKPNVKSWGSMVEIARRTARRFGLDRGARATIVATVPQQHMYGLETSIMLPTQHGLALDRGKPFFPEDVRIALERLPAPRVLITTPVHLRACVAENIALPAIELIVSATAPLSVELATQAERQTGAPVHEIYGWSEAGSVATRRTSAGPAWRVFDGSTLTRDAVSARLTLHAGFYPAAVPFEDLVEQCSGTEFELIGRNQDMINVAGKRVSLGDLNTKICALEGVRDAAFYLPRETVDGVTRLAAFVVAPGVGADQIVKHLRECVDAVFLPRPLVFVDALPRNETGKLPLDRLEALWRTHRPA